MATFDPYPHELWHLKCLLLHKQYHQCIKASVDALSSYEEHGDDLPLSGAFATFYLAAAHDELARSMHEHSAFKLTYFEKAEQHYQQVLKLLPSLEQCRNVLRQHQQKEKDCDGEDTLSSPPGTEQQPSLAPSGLARTQSTQRLSAEANDSDSDSHDSFDDFLESEVPHVSLPRPTLERDYSSMSLLDVRPRLNKSTSQGLLRPIRLGSPPKAHHLPPKINLLRRAKLATTVAQAERASRSQAPALAPQKRIPKSKSFWSFTPADVKIAEKEKKIEEGRARGWARKRYDPGKCEVLVENALAEL